MPVCTGFLLWLALGPALARAVPNDLFANRVTLSGAQATATGSNTNATKESGEPNHAGNSGGHSVWWSWTAPANGDVVITTDGSDFDTLLGVYTGNAVNALSLVASNDDHGASFINGVFTNGLFSTSRVRFQAAAARQYQIAVDGFSDGTGGATGSITLHLTFTNEPIVRPPNDAFANRAGLSGETVLVQASNVNATRETTEPYHAGRMGDTSVWWTWTAPSNTPVRISTSGSQFDTILGVYTGSSLGGLIAVAANDDEDAANAVLTSALIFSATAGTTYQIVVDGFDGAFGPITLTIEPVRTVLSAPEVLVGGSFQFVLNGLPGRLYDLEQSSDSGPWSWFATVSNATGSVLVNDETASNAVSRLYRAKLK